MKHGNQGAAWFALSANGTNRFLLQSVFPVPGDTRKGRAGLSCL